jgi:uncharacterized protein (DUF488 family)
MYYRRKVVLSLIQKLGDKCDKIKLQKMLFLYNQKQQNPVYDFIPYHYGCYSYSLNADLATMVKKKLLVETQKYFINNSEENYIATLNINDQQSISEIVKSYGNNSNIDLMRYTYINFPYYAINSKIARRILPTKYCKKIGNAIPRSSKKILFTIGYEGISLEKYLNKLLQNDIKILVDVRKNPLSMKYGFSKTLLKRYCESIGIQYLHFPEVGIASNKRQELKSKMDYENLFSQYCKSTIVTTKESQKEILALLRNSSRIALTCFEANETMCHRKYLAESIYHLKDFKFELKHI